jgi:diaminopimelate decarboxylase
VHLRIFRYAAKANGNLHIIECLKKAGVGMLVTVSGNEVLAGLRVGFNPKCILFNGNGKQE